MKKIISFSLWGDDPKYCIGAIKNAKLTNQIYPGWTSRFYCGKSVPSNIIEQLIEIQNCEVLIVDELGNWSGMFWRFLAASDSDVDVMISRDCDSRLNLREKSAVDQWMKSSKEFHIMRDHPWHTALILGGMWGVKYPKLNNMITLVDKYSKGDFWQVDQNFLKEIIYPIIQNDCMIHDEFFITNSNRLPFPSNRIGQEFVGESFDENDNPNLIHRSKIKLI